MVASQSSTANERVAKKAVDGNTAIRLVDLSCKPCCTQTFSNNISGVWWMLDMLAVFRIQQVCYVTIK